MKKKITYILSLLMIVCMLGACGSDNAEKTYGGYTTDELHTEATDSLSNIQNYITLVDSCGGYDSYEKSVKEVEEKTGMTEGEVVYNTLGQSGASVSMKNIDAELDVVSSWLDLVDKYGDVKDATDGKDFTVTKSGGTLTTDMTLTFGKQDVTYELVYDSVTREFDMICGKDNYTKVFCPQGEILELDQMKPILNKYLNGIEDAGKEFGINRKLSEETARKVCAPLIPVRAVEKMMTGYWENYPQ